MPRDSGPALKALGRVSLVISIVAFAALGIIGYSLYEETTYIIDNINNLQPDITSSTEEGDLSFKVNMTIPNRGVLPIQLMLSGDISSNQIRIAGIKPISETIDPGEEKNFLIEVPIDLTSIEGGNITLSINGTVSLQPFLSLSLTTSIDFSIPEFDIDISENDIQISPSSINRFNASHVSIPLNIQFTNKFPVNIQLDMKIVLTSTPINQAVSNYGETVFNIDLESDEMLIKNIEIETTNEIVSSGKYSFDVIFSIEGKKFMVSKDVNIVCEVCE